MSENKEKLKSFTEVVRELAEKYGIQHELLESILIDWMNILYYATTGRDPSKGDLFG